MEKKAGGEGDDNTSRPCFQTAQDGTWLSFPPLQEGTRVLSPSGNSGQQLRPQSGTWLWASRSMHSLDVRPGFSRAGIFCSCSGHRGQRG